MVSFPLTHTPPPPPPPPTPTHPHQRILTLCTARLADVGRLWASGDLGSAGLDAAAVRRLVTALFEDTPSRRATLAAIK